MKIFLIANNTETFVGMRLAGIDGVIVHTDEEFHSAFEKAFSDKETGIVLIMDDLYEEYSEFILDKKLRNPMPLIVSIPARNGEAAITQAVSSYIETAIGMKL